MSTSQNIVTLRRYLETSGDTRAGVAAKRASGAWIPGVHCFPHGSASWVDLEAVKRPTSPRSRLEALPEDRTPTALYRHFDAAGRLLYIGISLHALERLRAHGQRSHWANAIARVEIERHPSRKAALLAEEAAIRTESPLHNLKRT